MERALDKSGATAAAAAAAAAAACDDDGLCFHPCSRRRQPLTAAWLRLHKLPHAHHLVLVIALLVNGVAGLAQGRLTYLVHR
jgi:ABC-type nitrate/sulfonate/bicarbonate transport system substrate-binding protein